MDQQTRVNIDRTTGWQERTTTSFAKLVEDVRRDVSAINGNIELSQEIDLLCNHFRDTLRTFIRIKEIDVEFVKDNRKAQELAKNELVFLNRMLTIIDGITATKDNKEKRNKYLEQLIEEYPGLLKGWQKTHLELLPLIRQKLV
jgi:hypothetical protein